MFKLLKAQQDQQHQQRKRWSSSSDIFHGNHETKIKFQEFLRKVENDQRIIQEKERQLTEVVHDSRGALHGTVGNLTLAEKKLLELQRLIEKSSLDKTLKDEMQTLCSTVSGAIEDSQIAANFQKQLFDRHLNMVTEKNDKSSSMDEVVDVKQALQDSKFYNRMAVDKGLTLNIMLPEESVLAKGDSLRLQQIVFNLVTNAVKFTDQGHVDVQLEIIERTATDIRFAILVSDTGIGLQKNKPGHLKKSPIDQHFSSSGLGSIIVNNLLEKVHGNLTIESSDAGSVFRCEFVWQAVSIENNKDNQAKQKAVVPQVLQVASTKKLEGKILIADNDEMSVKILERFLKTIVTECNYTFNVSDTIKKIEEKNYDIIFIDLNMSVAGDGYEAIRKIRQHEVGKELPPSVIFVLTGDDSKDAEKKAFECGATDIFIKPYDFQVLEKNVRSRLDPKMAGSYEIKNESEQRRRRSLEGNSNIGAPSNTPP